MNDGKLIDLVHSYPHLYDRKRFDFKDTKKKENSWNEIATLLKYSVVDVQSRWKYLLEKYSRERKFDNNLPSGSSAPDKKPWEYLDALRWLDAYMQKRRLKSSLSLDRDSDVQHEVSLQHVIQEKEDILTATQENDSNDAMDSQDDINLTQGVEYNDKQLSRSTSCISSHPTINITNPVTPTNTRQASSRSQTESNVLVSTFKNMDKQMKSALNVFRERATADKEDDADLFGGLVASKLRRVTKRKGKEIKKIIFTVLMDGSDSE